MKNNSNIIEAFRFAYIAHLGKYRKGSQIPYIVHPMDVASILMKNGASDKLIVAGFLHDVIEDTEMDIKIITKKFGEDVSNLILYVSEPRKMRSLSPDKMKITWTIRKKHTIKRIINSDYETKLLFCADKLANLRDMVNDYKIYGNKLWDKFNASEKQYVWYYNSLVEAFQKGLINISNTSVFIQFHECTQTMFGNIIESG